MLIQGYCLPNEYRIEFGVPRGIVYTSHPSINAKFLSKYFKESSCRVIAVGDIVVANLVNMGFYPAIAIVDYKTKRNIISTHISYSRIYRKNYVIVNPPGIISSHAINVLTKILGSDDKVLVEVKGEEDLLVLPILLFSKNNDIVLYGQPDRGLVVVRVDEITRKTALNFWSLLKPCVQWLELNATSN